MEASNPGLTQAITAMRQPGVLDELNKLDTPKKRVAGADASAAALLAKYFNRGCIEIEHRGFSRADFPPLYLDDGTLSKSISLVHHFQPQKV